MEILMAGNRSRDPNFPPFCGSFLRELYLNDFSADFLLHLHFSLFSVGGMPSFSCDGCEGLLVVENRADGSGIGAME